MTGHGFKRQTNARGETWAACTCGWETAHAYYGDTRFVEAATGNDWDVHVGFKAPGPIDWGTVNRDRD